MRQSNTGEKNITYDASRNRFRVEMRVGKVSRTARCKTLEAALEVRNGWQAERDEMAAVAQAATSEHPGFVIEHRPVEVTFD